MNAELLKNLIIVITVAVAVFKVALNELDIRSSRTVLAGSPKAEVKKDVEYTVTKIVLLKLKNSFVPLHSCRYSRLK